MKTIDTLVQDIYALLDEKAHAELGDGLASSFSSDMASHMAKALASRSQEREVPKLYASEYGDKCLRRLAYKVHMPEIGEPLEPYTRFKFMYGDLLESTVLVLAKQSGHEVSHEQERIEYTLPTGALLTGRTDAIIDGHMVDVKTMSTYAFAKYKADGGVTEDNDGFGYRWQIAAYHHFYECKKEPYFLGIDKQNGHIELFPVTNLPSKLEVETQLERAFDTVYPEGSLEMPPRGYSPVPEGKSGNMKLDIACSYCAFKRECWPGLRTFLYSRGPVFLTHVDKAPNVMEVT
jgi:hypothetical protein